MRYRTIQNVTINIGEWSKGPFSNTEELESACQKVADIKPFLGNFMLIDSGELRRGHEKGLHTLVGNIDAGEEPHIHWDSKKGAAVNYLLKKDGQIFLRGLDRDIELFPKYTLDRLYGMLPTLSFQNKVDAITKELEKHGYSEELERFYQSTEKNKKLDLKLLERFYKKYISNQ